MAEYLYQDMPKLGFGLMRLPVLPGGGQKDIDFDLVQKLVDRFMEKGFHYFDTAYVYHEGHSEEVIKKCLLPKYPRDSFQVVDKIPLWDVKGPEDYEKILQTELERTGLDYLDILFLHGIGTSQFPVIEASGGWEWLKSVKERGLAKHIGFSYHSPAAELDALLDKHPEVEVVQLQLNYLDWDSESVQSRLCWEACRRHNVAVTIMEPVKGGSLANPHPDVAKLFKEADPEASIASWAIRFAATREGIITVLSGMNSLEQVEDNTDTILNLKPLSDAEMDVIHKAVKAFGEIPTIPCTGCRYCVDGCPQKIQIPAMINLLNEYTKYRNDSGLRRNYDRMTSRGGKASSCIQCRSCENHCPQHLKITEFMQQAAKQFEGV